MVDRLAGLPMPTLVVWGTRDRALPYSRAREAAARLRGGYLDLFPGCGPLPQVEQPERFSSSLGRFLGERRFR